MQAKESPISIAQSLVKASKPFVNHRLWNLGTPPSEFEIRDTEENIGPPDTPLCGKAWLSGTAGRLSTQVRCWQVFRGQN